MLTKTILTLITLVAATLGTPVAEIEKRNPCGSGQKLECCSSITTGIGLNCVTGEFPFPLLSHVLSYSIPFAFPVR
jgi:hypothetical protein